MANFLDMEQQPLGFRLIVLAVVVVLGTTYLLPLAGMAASGAWRAGLTYSLPVMVQVGPPTLRACPPACVPAQLWQLSWGDALISWTGA